MEQIVSLETAKLAKDRGFNVSVRKYYDKNDKVCIGKDSTGPKEDWDYNKSFIGWCSAPTQSILERWIRENSFIHLYPKVYYDSVEKKKSYACDVLNIGDGGIIKSPILDTFEEAKEYALKEGLKLIETK